MRVSRDLLPVSPALLGPISSCYEFLHRLAITLIFPVTLLTHSDSLQQPKRTRRKRKASKPTPVEPEATTKSTQASATNHTPTARQQEIQVAGLRPNARGRPHPRASAHRSEQIVNTSTATAPQAQIEFARKHRTNRKKRKHRSEQKPANMATPLSGVYVPPHLRKRATPATQPKADVRLGDYIATITPPASDKSRGEEPIQTQAPP